MLLLLLHVLLLPEAWHVVGQAKLLLEEVCLQMLLLDRQHATAESLLLLERVRLPRPASLLLHVQQRRRVAGRPTLLFETV